MLRSLVGRLLVGNRGFKSPISLTVVIIKTSMKVSFLSKNGVFAMRLISYCMRPFRNLFSPLSILRHRSRASTTWSRDATGSGAFTSARAFASARAVT